MRRSRVLFMSLLVAVLATAGTGAAQTYKVKKGDTLYELARKFHVKVEAIKDANDLKGDGLHPGARLKIPRKADAGKAVASSKRHDKKAREADRPATESVEAAEQPADRGAPNLHVVKRGDTLLAIAKAYGVDVKQLKERNGLKRKSILRPGMELKISGNAVRTKEARDQTYVVKRGDSLKKIARRFHTTAAELKELNDLRSADSLRLGQKLVVSKRAERLSPEVAGDDVTECKVEEATVEQDLQEISQESQDESGDLGVAQRLMRVAKRMLNIPYRFGGSSMRGIDCSAYVQKVFRFLNMSLPRTAREQYNVGSEVSREELAVGDLVFFRTYARYPSHVGIYIGDSQFIHASSKGHKVTIDSIDEPFYEKRFIGAKRLVKEGEEQSSPNTDESVPVDESAG